MEWYIKSGLLFFSALILVPWLYSKIRPNEGPIKEGNYPTKKTQITNEFGEFDSSDLPPVDMPMFGPSMSTAGRYTQMETQKEWLHPDVTKTRDMWKQKEEQKQEKETN
jgi:hypothetical protein